MSLFYLNSESDLPKLGKQLREELIRIGKPLEVSFKQARSQRSVTQLACFHILMDLILKETGDADVKDRIKFQLGYYKTIFVDGKEKQVLKSLAKATQEQAGMFIESAIDICRWLNLEYMTLEQAEKQANWVRGTK